MKRLLILLLLAVPMAPQISPPWRTVKRPPAWMRRFFILLQLTLREMKHD